jgi:S1-C subfamily serine protease
VLASEVQGSWGIGDTIPGLGQVGRIAPKWIELVDPAGHRGRLSLLGLEPAAGRGSDTAISESPPAAAPWSARIKKLDDQNYEVDRDLVRELVTGAAKPGGMRFLPKLDHGEVKGVRVYGVTSSSIPFALGLANGDTLEAIDGAPLKDLNQLLELYAKLDQLSAVELSGTRAGKPLARTLRLR